MTPIRLPITKRVITAPSREADCDTIPAFLAFAAHLTSRSVLQYAHGDGHTRSAADDVGCDDRVADRRESSFLSAHEPAAAEHGFDDFVEGQCASFYAETMGRPGVPLGIYFRLLLIGYFEAMGSERGIAWRAADSLALRDFLGVGLGDDPPDHSTISRTRRLIALETHRAVFTWVLQCLGAAGLVKGKTIGIDATTLEANAALRSIVRRDTGEDYAEFLAKLAKASGVGTPTRADLARIDRKRKKKGSNDEWKHPHDPDAKIHENEGRPNAPGTQGRARD
jgi:transposase